MKSLIEYVQSQFIVSGDDLTLLKKCLTAKKVPAKTKILQAGETEHYIYFLSQGIVKGYQNIDGKLVIQHLVSEQNFFTSLDSFVNGTPSLEYYETITDCKLFIISKTDYQILRAESGFWENFFRDITNEHLKCKLDRVKDFQILTAKERYLKFMNQYPEMALNVSIDNIASFLGIEPQSLSRIRKQIAF